MKICKYCGAEFTPAKMAHIQCYCSLTCQRKASIARKAERRRKAREAKDSGLDKTLEKAKALGMTFADYQRQKTLQMIREQEQQNER